MYRSVFLLSLKDPGQELKIRKREEKKKKKKKKKQSYETWGKKIKYRVGGESKHSEVICLEEQEPLRPMYRLWKKESVNNSKGYERAVL